MCQTFASVEQRRTFGAREQGVDMFLASVMAAHISAAMAADMAAGMAAVMAAVMAAHISFLYLLIKLRPSLPISYSVNCCKVGTRMY